MHPDDITVAARTMTEADPPADLELRIMRRLDEIVTAATPRWWPRYLYAAAGLSAVIVATLVVQGPGSRVQGPQVQESRSPGVQGSRSPGVQESSSPAVPESPISPSPHLPISPSPSEAELAWMARRIPALIQPEPLLITPLTIEPLVTSPVFGDPDAGRR